MKIFAVFIFLVSFGLIGCARVDMDQLSVLQPVSGGFIFKTFADTIYREDSPRAEKDRLAAMQRFVSANRLCPHGYKIDRREVIKKPSTALGVDTMRNINYHAHCLK